MKPSPKTLRLVLVGLIIGVIALVALIIAINGPLRRLEEFGCAESCKGYWATLQDFVKQKGRYPKDEVEIGAFFHTPSGSDPVEYVAPQDDKADEVVLWWKQRTKFGVRIGITESGVIVKK
jgi:hypothetical protein